MMRVIVSCSLTVNNDHALSSQALPAVTTAQCLYCSFYETFQVKPLNIDLNRGAGDAGRLQLVHRNISCGVFCHPVEG